MIGESMTVTRPPKLLKGNMSSPSVVHTYIDVTNPYFNKASSWAVSLYCASVPTGYISSIGGATIPYTVADINVGDWIASGQCKGIANRITSIVAVNVPSTGHITVIVDDPDCYNATLDTTGKGNGLISPGIVYVFETGINGIPVVTPEVSGIFDPIFGTDMLSRFLGRVQIVGNSTSGVTGPTGPSGPTGDTGPIGPTGPSASISYTLMLLTNGDLPIGIMTDTKGQPIYVQQ
jgi:hypothetical protein